MVNTFTSNFITSKIVTINPLCKWNKVSVISPLHFQHTDFCQVFIHHDPYAHIDQSQLHNFPQFNWIVKTFRKFILIHQFNMV